MQMSRPLQRRSVDSRLQLRSREDSRRSPSTLLLLQQGILLLVRLDEYGARSQIIPGVWLVARGYLGNDGLNTFCQGIWNVLCLHYQVSSPGSSYRCSCILCSATGFALQALRSVSAAGTVIGSCSYSVAITKEACCKCLTCMLMTCC